MHVPSSSSVILSSIVFLLLAVQSFSYLFDPYLSNDKQLSQATMGPFLISYDLVDPYIHIIHKDDPSRWLLRSLPSWPFITVGYATDSKPPIVDGNFKVNEWTLFGKLIFSISTFQLLSNCLYIFPCVETPYQSITNVITTPSNFTLQGYVWGAVTKASYEMSFYYEAGSNQLQFSIKTDAIQGTFNRLFLNYWCDPTEDFYGFGVQYTHWNMKGALLTTSHVALIHHL